MSQPQVESPEQVLATLLFNAGLEAARAGRHEEAQEAFQSATHLQPSDSRFAIVACKACFAAGQFSKARAYLEKAEAAGVDDETTQRMSQAIQRAVAVEASEHVPVRFEPGPMDTPGASWILTFCDWLEGIVHELCQDLRAGVARR